MEQEGNREKEHPVATFMASIQNVYLHEPSIVNVVEKPPSTHPSDRNRRVDSVTQWCLPEPASPDFYVGAVWEVKRPDATPAEIEVCENQVLDACERALRGYQTGRCYGFSGLGSLWRVFLYEKPGANFTCLTGDGEPLSEFYVDISDTTDTSEAWIFDSCLRDLREHMG
jgi:hypothetical protein